MSTWIIVALVALGLAALVAWGLRRRAASPLVVPFSELPDISDPAGHYALGVVGYARAPSAAPLVDPEQIKLGLFSLVPWASPFDAKAVRVFFGPHELGHLSRPDARAYRKQYGRRPARCRGLLDESGPAHAVWLTASLGSAATAACAALHAPALLSTFPVVVEQDEVHAQTRDYIMRGQSARIVDAQVSMVEDRAVVRALGSTLGHLSVPASQAFFRIHGLDTVGTQAFVKSGPDGHEVRLLANRALACLV